MVVPVNFSVSSQGNAAWVILATTDTRRRSRKILFAVRGGEEDICQNIFSVRCICHILNSKVIQQYQIELFGTEIDLSDTNQQRGRQAQPKHHTYKDHNQNSKPSQRNYYMFPK